MTLMINENEVDPKEIMWKVARKRPVEVLAIRMGQPFTVETLEGTMEGKPGDFLIMGVKGELYPCKPDIFEETYEWIIQST